MSHEYSAITFEVVDRIAIITMCRPEVRNKFSIELKEDLKAAFTKLQFARDIGAVILKGSRGVYSAGGDLKFLNEEARDVDWDRRRVYQVHDWFQLMLKLEIPLISAVDGPAYGGGFALTLGSDFVLASDRARFCCVFSRLGLVPDVGALFTLPRIVGLQKAKEIVMTNRAISASEARDLGIVMDLHAPEDLEDAAMELARRLAKASTPALGMAKQILTQSFNLDTTALIEMEAAAQAILFASKAHKSAIDNFMNKRPLDFNWEAFEKEADT